MRLTERLTKQFTQVYSQPESYHFCLETVIAAEFIAQQISTPSRMADFGTGCGVFGLELLHHFPTARLDSFEIQPEFAGHFETNRLTSPAPDRVHLHLGDIRLLTSEFFDQFDLIVANVPFFEPTESKMSNNDVRNNCRFLLNGGVSDFLKVIERTLRVGGRAFVLGRDQTLARALVPAELKVISRTEIRESILIAYQKTKDSLTCE